MQSSSPVLVRMRLSLAAALVTVLAAALLAATPAPAQAQTDVRWSVDRDDLGVQDGNDVSIEGEPIPVDGAGHPLVIGAGYDPEADPFEVLPARVVALDPADGTAAWMRDGVLIDDLGPDPIGVLSTGNVVVVDNNFDPDVGDPASQPVVLDAEDGSVVADYGDIDGYAYDLVVLPGDAVGFNIEDGSSQRSGFEVRELGGEVRWSSDNTQLLPVPYSPFLPDVMLAIEFDRDPDTGETTTSLVAFDLQDGTRTAIELQGEFAPEPQILPSGLVVAASSTGFDDEALGWVELIRLDDNGPTQLDVVSTADGDLQTRVFGLDATSPDGSTLVGVYPDYFGGEFAQPGPLRHQLFQVDQAAGTIDVGEWLDADFERSVRETDFGSQPVSTLNAAGPRGVPDASLMIAAVPNLGEDGQTAVYGQDLDGEVLWEIPASSDIGGTHRFSEVCADGSVYGRSSREVEVERPEGNYVTSEAVWYAIDQAAPAVEGDGCSRPYEPLDGDPGGPGGPGGPVGPSDGLACGGFDADPATTERADFDDPVEYAVAVSQARFGCGGADRAADHVVLSRDDAFADSLVGAALTGDAPLLFTRTDSLPAATAEEIDRLLDDGDTVYILGGEVAVAAGVEAELAASFDVQRLAGPSRVETSVAVAQEVLRLRAAASTFAADDVVSVAVARAGGPVDNPTAAWADSVTAGAWTAAGGVPTVVTDTASVHPAVATFIESLEATQPVSAVLLGGTAALSQQVADALPSPRRVAGDSRAGTAQAVATDLVGVDPGGKGSRLIVVNGYREDGWLFGLPAGGLAADGGAAIALAQTPVPPETLALACSPDQVDLLLVGSTAILDAQAAGELEATSAC